MATPLKDLYNPAFYDSFCAIAQDVIPSFNSKKFQTQIFDDEWGGRELKDRMAHTATVLHHYMDADYKVAAQQLVNLTIAIEEKDFKEISVEFMWLPTYIELFGVDDFDSSVKAMERITQFTSCEFAVRTFYLNYPEKMLAITKQWAKHKNFKVRRLASEGCRPRLPWAVALPYLKKDPISIIPILDGLKNDPEKFVRLSVANNLNDISKDHPDKVLELAGKWIGQNEHLDWLIKHALRTLLKQGNVTALSFFGYGDVKQLKLDNFSVNTPKVKIGESLSFQFDIENIAKADMLVRVEYAIYYLLSNGKQSKKVFKISEKEVGAQTKITVDRKQSFKLITTRTFYAGEHKVSVILNGKEFDALAFELS